ncbi:MAG: hypothetical protein R3F33_09705 [Planctomycetota bacterium]
MNRILKWLTAGLLVACQTSRPTPDPAPPVAVAPALPDGWQTGETRHFETLWNEPAWQGPLRWSAEDRAVLAQALGTPPDSLDGAETTQRAALWLSRDASPDSSALLIAHLERRLDPDVRGRNAADILAAEILARRNPLATEVLRSLDALALGPAPHPNLEVRVQCAAARLAHVPPAAARDLGPTNALLRFLLRVLRAETPAQSLDPPDWPRVETLAWSKYQAAAAVRRFCPDLEEYVPDASWAWQNEWAARAQQKLGL